jgi:hypothetical protein
MIVTMQMMVTSQYIGGVSADHPGNTGELWRGMLKKA